MILDCFFLNKCLFKWPIKLPDFNLIKYTPNELKIRGFTRKLKFAIIFKIIG